jgi:protein arginine kinase activator
MPTACQLCSSPLATVHLTELSSEGVRVELHVCRDCVARLSLALDNPPPLSPLLAQAHIQAGAPGDDSIETVQVPAPAEGEVCPQCGLEFAAYAQSNLFGCAECYATFTPQVSELVQRYHGAIRHVGRIPGGITMPEASAEAATDPEAVARQNAQQRLIAKRSARQSLVLALADAIAHEQFERAAALRDQLAAIDLDLAADAATGSGE